MTDKKEKAQPIKKAESPLNSLGFGYDSTLANGPFEREELHYADPLRNYDYKWCGACAFYEAGYCRALEENIDLLASCDAYLSMSEELALRWEQLYKRVNRLEREEDELRNKSEKPGDFEIVEEVDKFIEMRDGKYCVISHQTGKNFGCYKTKALAEKRLSQIARFKEANFEIKFAAKDEAKQIVYGIVLEPDEVDAHGDTITMEEVEKAAHGYALTPMVVGDGHTKKAKAQMIETFIYTPELFKEVKSGSWVMAIKVHSKKLWKGIQDGDYTGFSIGAFVKKRPFVDEEVK
jgi:hypothetical protein